LISLSARYSRRSRNLHSQNSAKAPFASQQLGRRRLFDGTGRLQKWSPHAIDEKIGPVLLRQNKEENLLAVGRKIPLEIGKRLVQSTGRRRVGAIMGKMEERI
jgi:hypothetical protein